MLQASRSPRTLNVARAVVVGFTSCLMIACGAKGGHSKLAADLFESILVSTELGEVQGVQAEHGETFFGIAYGQAPVNELRWHAPLPYGTWANAGVLDARWPQHRCPQQLNPLLTGGSEWEILGDEDCLFLNIHRPSAATRAKLGGKLPVMVWIHGGSYTQGSGDTYDGEQLAEEQGVIIVTINYRLGALGFLAHPALRATNGEATSGNYALQDQILALNWVNHHIAAFGGDSGKVTIFGESAGGHSVCTLVATPAAAGLFGAAIIQSGTCGLHPFQSRAKAEASGQLFAERVGCGEAEDVASCLRQLPAATVAAAGLAANYGWTLSAGNALLAQSPSEVFASNSFRHVPVMIGTTHDENRLFQLVRSYVGGSLSEAQYVEEVRRRFQGKAEAILATYPSRSFATRGLALAAVITDYGQACPLYRFSAVLAANTPTFVYEFNDPNTVSNLLPSDDIPSLGAYHSGELTYLFHKFWFMGNPDAFSDEQQALAVQMATYWANFAKFGQPNGPGIDAVWPVDTPSARSIHSLRPAGSGIKVPLAFAKDHHCDLFD